MQAEATVRNRFAPFFAGRMSLGACLGLTPQELTRIFQLGFSCFVSRRFEQAERIFETVSKIEPGLPLAHMYLGLALDRGGRRQDALASFDRALALLEGDVRGRASAVLKTDLRVMRASVLLRLGRQETANLELEEVDELLLSPSSRREYERLRHFSTGGGS